MNIKRFLIVMTFSIVAEALFAKSFSFGVQGDVGVNSAIIENSSGNKSDFDFLPAFRFGGGAEFSFNEITSLQLKTLFHHNNGFSFTDSNGKTKLSLSLAHQLNAEIINPFERKKDVKLAKLGRLSNLEIGIVVDLIDIFTSRSFK